VFYLPVRKNPTKKLKTFLPFKLCLYNQNDKETGIRGRGKKGKNGYFSFLAKNTYQVKIWSNFRERVSIFLGR